MTDATTPKVKKPNEGRVALNKAERRQRLLANGAFGADVSKRVKAIDADTMTLWRISLVAICVGAWGLFWPRPNSYCTWTLIGFPVLAIVLVVLSRGRWSLTGNFKLGRLGLPLVWLVPAAALTWRTWRDVSSWASHNAVLVDWGTPLPEAILFGSGALIVIIWTERRFNWALAAVYCAVHIAYGYSLIVQLGSD